MPKIIDERVVEMKFDNKQFEQNAQNSLKTLDNLKKSLNFNGATKGLQQFEKLSNGINLSGMESAIQTVQNRFSNLGVMGDQIIRRLTDSALNMARRMGQEFTIKPMQTGFQEYETQINAVQTIMANTGAPIEDVNAALDELNAYADKTIYNFTEMTRNIGTFTAAGVDMDTSVEAIKGIANLAAISGSSSQQASTAMYQLSQALASGTVKLMDWNSVVNAGMGGQVFQDALKETARVHGIAVDTIIAEQGSFRESLKTGWLSSEVLTDTLAKFTGDLSEEQLRSMGYTAEQAREIYELGVTANDAATKVKTFTQLFDTLAEARQSGWTQSWEIIIGDFEEAKGLLSTISERFNESIGDSANARNLVLQQWSDLGGRTLLIESVINVLDTLEGMVWSVKNAFHEIFPEVTAENLFNITSKIWELTEGFKNLFSFGRGAHFSIVDTSVGEMLDKDKFAVLGPVLENISKVFKGFFAVIDSGIYIIKNIGKIAFDVLSLLSPIGFGVLDIFGNVGDYFVKIRDSIKDGTLLARGFEFFETVVSALQDSFIELLSAFMTVEDELNGVYPNVKTAITNITEPIVNFVKDFYNYIANSDFISKAIAFFKNAITGAVMAIPLAISAFASLLNKIKIYIRESELIEKVTSKISSVVTNLVKKVKTGYSAIQDFLKSAKDFIKTNAKISNIAKKIKEVFSPVGEFVGKFWGNIITAFNEAKEIDISSISGIFEKIKAKMAPFKRIFTELYSPIEGLKKIGIAIKNLFGKIKNAIIFGWEAIPDVFKDITSGFVNGVRNFISSAVSVIKELVGKVNFGDAIKLIGTTSALINIISFTRGLKNMVKGINNIFTNLKDTVRETLENMGSKEAKADIADTILKIVSAVGILVVALWGISKIDQNRLNQSVEILAGLAVGMLAFVFVLKKITKGGTKEISDSAGALLKISGSLAILVFVIKKLAGIDVDTLNTGLGRLVELLGVLAIFTRLAAVPKGRGLSGYFGLAISVVILAQELKDLAGIDDAALMQGLKGMGGILLELAVFSRLAKSSNFSGAGTRNPPFIKMAISVAIFAQVLKGLSGMNYSELSRGLIALGAILLEIGIFSRLMSETNFNFKNTLLMLVALGGSLLIFIQTLNALSDMKPYNLSSGIKSIGEILLETIIFSKLLSHIKFAPKNTLLMLVALGGSLLIFIQTLKELSDIGPDKVSSGIKSIGEILLETIIFSKKISGINFNFKNTLLMLVALGGSLLIFTESIRKICDISGGKIFAFGASFGLAIISLGITFSILAKLPISGALIALANLAIAVAGITGIVALIGAIAQIPGFDWLITEGGNALGLIGSAIGKFVHGIINPSGKESPAKETKTLADFGNELSTFMTNLQPFIEGAKGIDEAALNGVKNLAGMCMAITGAQFLDGIARIITGESSLSSFGTQLVDFGDDLSEFSKKTEDIKVDSITAATTAANEIAEFAKNVPEQSIIEKALGLSSNLKTFATDLGELGPNLKLYNDNVKDMDTSSVTASAKAATALAEFAKNVPEQSILDKVLGLSSNLKTFAGDLVELGPNLYAYYNNIKDIKFSVVTKSANAAKVLSGFAQNVPEQSILDKVLGMKSNLSTFAGDLVELGPSIKKYSDSVKDIDENAVASSTRAAGMLNDFANTLTKQGGLLNTLDRWIFGDESMTKFSEEIAAFGSKMNEFASYFGDNAPNDIPEAVTIAGGVVDSLKELFSEGESSKAFSGSIANLTRLLDNLLTQLTIYYPNFYDTGSSIMSNITDGMNSLSDLPVTIFATTIDSCIRTLENYDDDFYTIGENYVIGIANGIENRVSLAVSAANRIANGAINASKRGFDERSPSKEGYQIGAYFTEGIANGMTSLANLTNRASEQVSSGAIHAAQTAMSMINSIIEAGDTNPTIRPVLDLSNIANGAGQINSLLGQTKTLTADAINVRSFNQRAMSLQSGINQNGSIGRDSNRDVVAAINTLGSRIDTMNEEIHNLKIVLNTGVLAGELEPEINRRLGLRMAYEERGV